MTGRIMNIGVRSVLCRDVCRVISSLLNESRMAGLIVSLFRSGNRKLYRVMKL